jgi:hypothetical protein
MKLAVLRLCGQANSPELVAAALGVAFDSIWHAGEKTLTGGVREDSGVSFVVSDAESVHQLTDEVREFFQTARGELPRLRAEGWHAELDIGVTVGDSAQYTVAVSLEPSLLELLGSLGVSVCFSAYPSSDEADAQAV